jgi:RNA 2',3'-cyclic 3'-phosphodiesterase
MKVDDDGRSPRGRGASQERRRAAAKLGTARVFVALYPPAGTTGALLAKLADHDLPPHRATTHDQLHLTALFVGDVLERDLERVRESVTSAARGVAPFDLAPLHLAPLPQDGPARLLAAICDLPSALSELHERLAHRLATHKRSSQTFLPHLTLCRFERPVELDLADSLLDVPPFRVETVHLMQSRLGPDGALHRGLARVPLGG